MNDKKIVTINPATDQVLAEYDSMNKEQVVEIIKKSRNGFAQWKTDSHNRSFFLHQLSEKLQTDRERLAKIATQEMGKPIKESRAELDKCSWVMDFYAYNGKIFLHDESLNSDAIKTTILFQPLGIIGSIMPWNFPYWQALRVAAPALMTGNTIVLKPSSTTPQCGIEIENLMKEIDLQEGVFSTLVGNSSVGEILIDSDINGITFTGSVEIGAKVAQRATSQLKKCVLELGGSDPFIVLDDADIDKSALGAVKGRFLNCGQSCIASKRFIITKNVANEFIEKFVEKTEDLKVGDPMKDETDIGPLSSMSSIEKIDMMVKDAISKGGEIFTGGDRIGGKGAFYKPTIIGKVTSNMRVAKEETFGPVAPITVVEDESEAIKIANNSEFGLGACIWTQNLDKAETLSEMVESGLVTVNNVVRSDPRIPFGGVKHSGFGRELSRYGMLEFVNIKSVRFYDRLVHQHQVE
ncbi:MAG TPA: NAD-dependent succinate-semialdehyde dehydrogenase [Nitrososphaeraceae archaeon]|nr:NAD-dependent succinate-semialdehyde dehydrogenase [Nitrososphaeraceae archaeon]